MYMFIHIHDMLYMYTYIYIYSIHEIVTETYIHEQTRDQKTFARTRKGNKLWCDDIVVAVFDFFVVFVLVRIEGSEVPDRYSQKSALQLFYIVSCVAS